MPIQALKFTAKPPGSDPSRSELPCERVQDLEKLRDDTLPVVYLLRSGEDLEALRQFKDIVLDRGFKNIHKGLASYLLGLGTERIPLLEGRYGASGQLLRSIRTLLTRAAAKGERNLYLLGVEPEIFTELWEKAGQPQAPKAAAKPPAGKSTPRQTEFSAAPPALFQLMDRLEEPAELSERFLGRSNDAQLVRQLILRAAQLDTPVLITGDTGSGKELVAREIHECSQRKGQPFVPVNCGAIPSELLEAELFGYQKGSHSTAFKDKMGLWEYAGGGTLFLDEIADLQPRHQVKILRALQENQIHRVGETRDIKVHARVLAAANRDLFAMVQGGEFREDLYYRLRGFLIRTPALREHADDIPLLAQALWKNITGDKNQRLPETLLAELKAYRWPGNVRELRTVLSNLWGFFPEAAKAEKLRLDHLLAIFYLEGQNASTPDTPIAENAFTLYRAECLRHLRRLDETVRAIQVTVTPPREKEPANGMAVDNVQAALRLRFDELNQLCTRRLLFHSDQMYACVARLIWKLESFQKQLREDSPDAWRYWTEDVNEEFKLLLSALFKEVERVLGSG
jgi:DNA-binding NtrC family response regulator